MQAEVGTSEAMRPWSHWSAISQELHNLRSQRRRILYMANPGNAGDALIASATWQFFDAIGLKPKPARASDMRAGDVVIYGGGGNLVPMYPDAKTAIETALRVGVAHFVLLPHTVRGHEDLLSALDHRFSVYCRDIITYEHVQARAGSARLALVPDMALGIDVERLRHRVATLPLWWFWRWAGLRKNRRQSYQRWLALSDQISANEVGLLEVYRSDQESARSTGIAEKDLSGLYCSSLRSRNECDAISARFLTIIDRASRVSTDRLHVGIGGQLLGKSVVLFDNSYGKNHAVASAFPTLLPSVCLA
jgi:exopolysaccharide biosynthesis predicted pyruvyltransferase EpsI